jgi:hypothetical protein
MGPHFWIDLPDGRRVDYRIRRWLGDHEHIPHGVFDPVSWNKVEYAIVQSKNLASNDVEVAEVLASINGVNFSRTAADLKEL